MDDEDSLGSRTSFCHIFYVIRLTFGLQSYVLHQERRIISSKTAGLSKLAPRKSSRATQPLINVATSIGVAPKATTGSHFAQRGRFET